MLINMDIKFLIQIMYGRILTIVSNNNLLNNKTFQLEVTIDLGKEILNKYLLECFNDFKKSNPNIWGRTTVQRGAGGCADVLVWEVRLRVGVSCRA